MKELILILTVVAWGSLTIARAQISVRTSDSTLDVTSTGDEQAIADFVDGPEGRDYVAWRRITKI